MDIKAAMTKPVISEIVVRFSPAEADDLRQYIKDTDALRRYLKDPNVGRWIIVEQLLSKLETIFSNKWPPTPE